jgi:hypothetical protein
MRSYKRGRTMGRYKKRGIQTGLTILFRDAEVHELDWSGRRVVLVIMINQ